MVSVVEAASDAPDASAATARLPSRTSPESRTLFADR
jgi:hypothetical protein